MIAQADAVSQSVAEGSAEASAQLGGSAPVRQAPPRNSGAAAQTVGRTLLILAGLAMACCMLLALIGLYANSSSEPKGMAVEAEHANHAVRFEQLAPARGFQQGQKLVGAGAVGSSNQGMSVALSADGHTAIVGGPGPNNADHDRSPSAGPAGSAWIFTRSGGAWTQQGSKLVGRTSEHGGGLWSQGASVALSADGDTALVGGPSDDRTMGAAWVFIRSGSAWTQQGSKLVGSGANRTGEPPLSVGQGTSVALSADGNTAIVGGLADDRGVGAASVFARSGDHWTQDERLAGTGAMAVSSVALSGDGSIVMVGGPDVGGGVGATWVFARGDNASVR